MNIGNGKLDFRAMVGWRRLPTADRKVIARHVATAESCFASLEDADPKGTLLADAALIDVPGRDHLDGCGPGELLAARVAACARLRVLPVDDDGRMVSLRQVRHYRSHFAAMRIIELTDPYELAWDHHDVRALFSIATNPKGATPEQSTARINIPTGFPPYAAQRLIDLLVAPVRLDLLAVAVGAAEQLTDETPPPSLAKAVERAKRILALAQGRDFAHNEALDRLDSLFAKED